MRRRLQAVALGLALVALVSVVAMAAPGVTQVSSGPLLTRLSQLDPPLSVVLVLGVAVLALLVASAVSMRGSVELPSRRGTRFGPLVMVAGILLLFFVIRRLLPPDAIERLLGEAEEADPPTTGPGPVTPAAAWWGMAILVAALVVSTWALRRPGRRRQVEPPAPPDPFPPEVMTWVEPALERLRLGDDPRSEVLRAYAAMEAALANEGAPRRAWETPGEYLARVTPLLPVSREAGQELRALFEVARFSRRPVGPPMLDRARQALERVRSELAGFTP